MNRKIIGSAVIAGTLAGGLAMAAPANADTTYSRAANAVCTVLDQYPNDTGVTMVITTAINSGFDGATAGTMVYNMVNSYCPNHKDELLHWANN